MPDNKLYSAALVCAQLALIALIFSPLSALWPPDSLIKFVGLALLADAMAIALWALFVMKLQHFSVMPEPKNNASLVTDGPYRFVRHPMYSAVLLACFGTCLMQGEVYNWFWLLLLLLVLLLKIQREETLLASQYPDYPAYRDHTNALIPWIY